MPLIFIFLFFLTLQESIYAMKRSHEDQIVTTTNESQIVATTNESSAFIFNDSFLKHWQNTLNNKRYAPLDVTDIEKFKDLEETAEFTRSILLVNKKAHSLLSAPFKKFLSNIRINNGGLLDKHGEPLYKMFLEDFYNKGIPSAPQLKKLLKRPDTSTFNFNNPLDTIQINTGFNVEGKSFDPLLIKKSFLQDILASDAFSQNISNLDNIANEQNECMGYENDDGGPDNEAQGNIMPYLLSCALFLKESSDKLSNPNIMKAHNWIIHFFKKILYTAGENSVVFTDKNHDTQGENVYYVFATENNTKYGVKAAGPNLALFKKEQH
jgi:hypothetical protein